MARDDDGSLRVHGRGAERAVALSDVTTPDAQAYVRDRLERLGVTKALVRAGARRGRRGAHRRVLVRLRPRRRDRLSGVAASARRPSGADR